MLLTLLRGVSDKGTEQLLQLLASASRTGNLACCMLFQCYHDQRFFPAIEALIVVHRHGVYPFESANNHEWISPLVQQRMGHAAEHHTGNTSASTGSHENKVGIQGLGFLKNSLDRGT